MKKIDGRSKTSAKNGDAGGRPRETAPQELLDRLGSPPTTPLELARWNQRMMSEVAMGRLNGTIGPGLADDMRKIASTISKALPTDILVEIEKMLNSDDKDMKADVVGPPLQKVPDGEPDLSIRYPTR